MCCFNFLNCCKSSICFSFYFMNYIRFVLVLSAKNWSLFDGICCFHRVRIAWFQLWLCHLMSKVLGNCRPRTFIYIPARWSDRQRCILCAYLPSKGKRPDAKHHGPLFDEPPVCIRVQNQYLAKNEHFVGTIDWKVWIVSFALPEDVVISLCE